MNKRKRRAVGIALMLMTALMQGCSVYMESTRPTPVDLLQFQPGDTRDAVVEKLGSPESVATESDGDSCDSYNLYTHGYGAAGKAGIALLEGAADVFTLGLAEVITTPAEGVTKNEKHRVTFCYRDAMLARVSEDGNEIAPSPGASSDIAQSSAKQATASNR